MENIIENKPERDSKGHFLPGNRIAANINKVYDKKTFLSCLEKVGEEHGEDYLLHILRVNWNNPKFHKTILDKFVEDATIASVGKIPTAGNTIILTFKLSEKSKEQIIEVIPEIEEDKKSDVTGDSDCPII